MNQTFEKQVQDLRREVNAKNAYAVGWRRLRDLMAEASPEQARSVEGLLVLWQGIDSRRV